MNIGSLCTRVLVAGSIAALILTVDCLIADAPRKPAQRLPEGALPEG